MTEPDALRILGLNSATSADEVKRAWRRVVKQTHPDLHPNDPRANVRFQLVQEAYDLLRIRFENGGGPITMQSATRSVAYHTPAYAQRPYAPDLEVRSPSPPRPERVSWGNQQGTWRSWAYVVFWKLWALPFVALLVVALGFHQQVTDVQAAFRNAPRCATDSTSDAGCILSQPGDVTGEDCAACPGAAAVGPTPAITVNVDGLSYNVNVVAAGRTAKNRVYAFDHSTDPGASQVTVQLWKGRIVSVAGLPTTDSPPLMSDRWADVAVGMAVPIAFILLAPSRIVDLVFRIIGLVLLNVFRAVVLVLSRA